MLPAEETTIGRHRYRLRSTGFSSSRYGPCEVCGAHVAEVFIQTESQLLSDSGGEFWAIDAHRVPLGHRDCLIGLRVSEETAA